MSYTKSEIVKQALSELGIADYEFDISPEEVSSGVRRLDSMIAHWGDRGVKLSYPFGGDVDDDSNLPNVALEAVITNLAVRLAPSYGKQAAPSLLATAKDAMNSLFRFSAHPTERQMRVLPRGAGYKNHDEPFMPPTKERFLDDVDDSVDLSGGPDGT